MCESPLKGHWEHEDQPGLLCAQGSTELCTATYNIATKNQMPFVCRGPEKYLKAQLLIVLVQMKRENDI